jgi:hypothetical protein
MPALQRAGSLLPRLHLDELLDELQGRLRAILETRDRMNGLAPPAWGRPSAGLVRDGYVGPRSRCRLLTVAGCIAAGHRQ